MRREVAEARMGEILEAFDDLRLTGIIGHIFRDYEPKDVGLEACQSGSVRGILSHRNLSSVEIAKETFGFIAR